MLERYDFEICNCPNGPHIEAVKNDDGSYCNAYDAQQAVERLRESRQCAETYMSIIADKLQFSSSQFSKLSSGWCEELANVITDLQAQLAAAQADREANDKATWERVRLIDDLKQQVAQLREMMTVYKDEYKTVLQAKAKEIGEIQANYIQLHTAHTTLRGLVGALPVAGLPAEHSRPDDFIAMKDGEGWLAHTYNYWAKFATEDEAKAYAALLEYRATLPREGGEQEVGDE